MSDIKGLPYIPPVKEQPKKRPSLEELMQANGFDSPGKPGGGPPAGAPPKMKPAIYVKDGKLLQAESAAEVLYGGRVDDETATDVKIVAYDGNIGGLYVENSEYTLENAVIHLSGDGQGLGGKCAGASVGDHGTLTLRNVNISMTGESRCATSAEGKSILRVYDSTLITHGAPYGVDTPNEQLRIKPPAALEIAGNCRTHCTVQNSYSYFYNSTIITDGWAALSTDMSDGFVYLEANDCRVISTKNGYGAYADTYCHDLLRRCVFDVSAMAVIIAGESDATFIDSKLNCGSYLALMHCVMGQHTEVGHLRVTGGSVNTKKDAVLIKSQNALVELDGVQLTAQTGVLVHSIINDDPVATRVNGRTVYGIHIKLKDMAVTGSILHEDTDRKMTTYLQSTILKGQLMNISLIMDIGSKWIATADSQVILESGIDLEQIDAPFGVTIRAQAATAGEFQLESGGKLIVKVAGL